MLAEKICRSMLLWICLSTSAETPKLNSSQTTFFFLIGSDALTTLKISNLLHVPLINSNSPLVPTLSRWSPLIIHTEIWSHWLTTSPISGQKLSNSLKFPCLELSYFFKHTQVTTIWKKKIQNWDANEFLRLLKLLPFSFHS